MKVILIWVAVVIVVITFVFVFRWFSNVTIHEDVIHPVKGVSCIKLATSDGVAVSCWKD